MILDILAGLLGGGLLKNIASPLSSANKALSLVRIIWYGTTAFIRQIILSVAPKYIHSDTHFEWVCFGLL